jgi:hypothetical protein
MGKLHRFTGFFGGCRVDCAIDVDRVKEAGHVDQLEIQWNGRPRKFNMEKYIKWMVGNLQTVCDLMNVKGSYLCQVGERDWDAFDIAPNQPPTRRHAIVNGEPLDDAADSPGK